MTEPKRLDSFTLTDETDFADLAASVLSGRVGGSTSHDSGPTSWFDRAYPELDGSPYQDMLSRGVAACLTHSDSSIRLNALMFFASHPAAAGAETVLTVAAGDRALFREPKLQDKLMRALGALIKAGNTDALALGRQEALTGDPDYLMAALAKADPDWVDEHAEAIVRANPSTGMTILYNFQKIGRDVTETGIRIAHLAKVDRGFSADLKEFIRDDDARAAIRKAMRKPTSE